MVLLVRNSLVIITADSHTRSQRLRNTVVVGIRQGLITDIEGLVVDGLYRRVGERRLVVVVEFRVTGVQRIDQQVQGIVVELEVLTVLSRERRPGLQSRVLLAGLEIVTTVVTGLMTDIGLTQLLVDSSLGNGIAHLKGRLINIYHLIITLGGHHLAIEHRILGIGTVELQRTGADTGQLNLRTDGSPGCRRVVVHTQGRTLDEVVGLTIIRKLHIGGGHIGLSHLSLLLRAV